MKKQKIQPKEAELDGALTVEAVRADQAKLQQELKRLLAQQRQLAAAIDMQRGAIHYTETVLQRHEEAEALRREQEAAPVGEAV